MFYFCNVFVVNRVLSSSLQRPPTGSSTTSLPAGSLPRTARRSTATRTRPEAAAGTPTTGAASKASTEQLRGPPSYCAPAGKLVSARQTVKQILDIDAGPQDIGVLSEQLGIPFSQVDSFYETLVDKGDPFIKYFFEYELGEKIGGRQEHTF